MIITNKYNLPEAFVKAIQNSRHNADKCLSATTLLKDFSISEAKKKADYSQSPVYIYEFDPTPEDMTVLKHTSRIRFLMYLRTLRKLMTRLQNVPRTSAGQLLQNGQL